MYSSSGSNLVFAIIGYSVIPLPNSSPIYKFYFLPPRSEPSSSVLFPSVRFVVDISFLSFHFCSSFLLPAASHPAPEDGWRRKTNFSFLDSLPELSREGTAVSFTYLLTSVLRCLRISHSAQAIPSGSFPVSNVAVTSKFLRSTTTTLLSPLTATNAFDPSGTIKIPSGLFPSLSRFTSFLVFASSTTSSPPPASEISTCFPSGVNFNRFECFVRTFTVPFPFFVPVSIIVTVPSPEFPAHTSNPSGAISIASGPFPTGITVLNHFFLSADATTAVTESEFTFDV